MEGQTSHTLHSDNKELADFKEEYISGNVESTDIKQEHDIIYENQVNIEPDVDNEMPFNTGHVDDACHEWIHNIKEDPDIHSEQEADVKQEAITSNGQEYNDVTIVRNEELAAAKAKTYGNLADIKHEPGNSDEISFNVKQEDDTCCEQQSDVNNTLHRCHQETNDVKLEVDPNDCKNCIESSVHANMQQFESGHSVLQIVPLTSELGKDTQYTIVRSDCNPNDSSTSVDSSHVTDMNQHHEYSEVSSPQMTEKVKTKQAINLSKKSDMCQFPYGQAGPQPKHKKVFVCDMCQYTCKNPSSLKLHKMTHNGENPYSCDMCRYTCREAWSLKRHKMIHTGEKPYSCETCSYTCREAGDMKKHKRTHTGEKPYSCDMCMYTGKNAGQLKSHKMTHTDVKPYSCDVCQFTCKYPGNLQKHKKTHSSEKPYSCDVCQFKCRKAWDLKQHKVSHTDEKPFSCDMCTYRCKLAKTLKQHQMTHTVEKPYSCDICDYKCHQAGRLKEHCMTHTDEKPYSCAMCQYTCRKARDLKKHKLKHAEGNPYAYVK